MTEFEKAQWDIPHCKYERTPDGFKVNYTTPRRTSPLQMVVAGGAGLVLAVAGLVGGFVAGDSADSFLVGVLAFLAILCGGFFVIVRLIVGRVHTSIEVTQDAVIIDKKKLRRADFGHFAIGSTVGIAGTAVTYGQSSAILAYTYGRQSFEFGGTWLEKQAIEFVSALNNEMRANAEDEITSPSPETLRFARPANF